MRDLACEFGESGRLKGIVSLPSRDAHSGFALVLVSAGFTSKTGPYRLYTELARAASDMGFLALRFDLGGIGDSQILNPDQPLAMRTNADIQEAFNYLQEEHGVQSFVIGGLCSGAEDAFRYAEDDGRVKGVVLVDPHAYRTKGWWVRNVFSRHFFNRVIFKFLRVFNVIRIVTDGSNGSAVEGLEGDLIDYQYIRKDESSRILQKLMHRKVHLHYIYTGGRTDRFNHKAQFSSMFEGIDFNNNLVLDYLPHIAHVQVFEEDRVELISTIIEQLRVNVSTQ